VFTSLCRHKGYPSGILSLAKNAVKNFCEKIQREYDDFFDFPVWLI